MSTPDRPLTWVVGAGGLLGSSVVAAAARRGPVWSPAVPVTWATDRTADDVAVATRGFLAAAGDGPWQVAWCAGSAVTAADDEAMAREAHVFGAHVRTLMTARHPRRGALFLASSAGGVYAGSTGQPFGEDTVPVPISPYGRGKLAMEEVARTAAADAGLPLFVGRIANLYGPGQDVGKAQGLVTHIARSYLLRQPISIYVSLDTVRDYLFAPDCAELVLDGLDRLRTETSGGEVPLRTKVIASQNPVTIGFLVAEIANIVKRRPLVVYGASSLSKYQARNLRLESQVWPELDQRPLTPFAVGIERTIAGLLGSLQAGALA